jgi:Ca2+-binding EF-hand superfamily protein
MKFLVREFGQSKLTLSATLQKLEEATSGAELLRSSFNDFDKDDNGKISLDELIALLKSINIDLPRNQAEVRNPETEKP